MLSTGVMPIPCPHFKITIVKRSQGQSAVAGAAYQSGERLFSEYDQKTKFYNKKKELVHAEIMLPARPTQRSNGCRLGSGFAKAAEMPFVSRQRRWLLHRPPTCSVRGS